MLKQVQTAVQTGLMGLYDLVDPISRYLLKGDETSLPSHSRKVTVQNSSSRNGNALSLSEDYSNNNKLLRSDIYIKQFTVKQRMKP